LISVPLSEATIFPAGMLLGRSRQVFPSVLARGPSAAVREGSPISQNSPFTTFNPARLAPVAWGPSQVSPPSLLHQAFSPDASVMTITGPLLAMAPRAVTASSPLGASHFQVLP